MMQISNPVISQYLNSTVNGSANRTQQADRLPVKAVTIEGQLLDEDKQSFSSTAINQDDESQQQSSQLIAPVNQQQNTPASNADNVGSALLIQRKLGNNSLQTRQNESAQAEPSFPYGSRRSSQGVAGSSLVLQNYLSNESTSQSNKPQGLSGPSNIDVFI